MISLKYAAARIKEFGPVTLEKHAKALLVKIHVITGWTIPTGEVMKVLIEQFCKKLSESYGEMNTEEIEYAFRRHGTTVEDWGKSMNLNLVDKVLIPYLQTRVQLSETEEKIRYKPEQKIYSDEQLADQAREETEACYQRFLNGNTVYFPSNTMRTVLQQDGFNPGEDIMKFFEQMQNKGARNLYQKS